MIKEEEDRTKIACSICLQTNKINCIPNVFHDLCLINIASIDDLTSNVFRFWSNFIHNYKNLKSKQQLVLALYRHVQFKLT